MAKPSFPARVLATGVVAGAAAGRMLRGRRHRSGEAQVADLAEQLGRTRTRLVEAQAEAERAGHRAQAATDQAETEMGRMETAAITALESAAASNRQEVADLRERLDAAEEQARALRAELDAERRQTDLLRAALAGRDGRPAGP